MNKKILFLITSVILVFPTLITAEGVTIESMVSAAVHTVWIIAAGIVVVLWIVTGILFLLAQTNPSKLTSAKTALLTSIAGTVLVILAFSALKLIGSSIGAPI